MRIPGQRSLRTKGVAVAVAGIAFVTLGGTASAASAAAKQYEKIVAPFNKLLGAQNAPSTSKLRSTMSSTEKELRSAHWPKKAAKDVKGLVSDLQANESFFVAEAKANGNAKPNAAQKAAGLKLFSQISKVRKDLGLPASAQNGL